MINLTKTKWKNEYFELNRKGRIPALSGIYIVSDVGRIANIPTNLDIYYIGKSNNLYRRFSQHLDPYRSHNSEFYNKVYQVSLKKSLEFWYVRIDEEDLKEIEDKLIKALKPKFNKLLQEKNND